MFERYLAVDWSANNAPKSGKDSIWSGMGSRAACDLETRNHRTRLAAEAWLLEQLTAAVASGERVLVGLDFPYGFPSGFAAALGLSGEPWEGIWDYLAGHIEDDDKNASNRFELASEINGRLGRSAPFWGRPANLALPTLPSKKQASYLGPGDPAGLPEWRQVELRLRESGERPHSVWKLAYNGSVGSQSLVGIPVLQRLRNHERLKNVSRVWPFEVEIPDLRLGGPAVIHAEIWPSIVPFGHEQGACRDEKQVRAVVECWRALDEKERLRSWFATPVDERVRREEGWILGVPSGLGLGVRSAATLTPPTLDRRPSQSSPAKRVVRDERPPCLCGCGNYPRGKGSRFMPGHDQRRDPATGKPFNAS